LIEIFNTNKKYPGFYVYALLDPRIPSKGSFVHIPFYIGKGKNNRVHKQAQEFPENSDAIMYNGPSTFIKLSGEIYEKCKSR